MKKKRGGFLWLALSAILLLSVFVGLKTESRAEGGVVLKVHYHRADGDYSPWSVWLWEAGKDGSDNAFVDDNGEKVATFNVTPGTVSVGFIVRTQDWGKDIGEDQFIDIAEMVSGTVHIYIESGVKGYTKEYGEDAVCGVRVKNARYNGEGAVLVTMTGEPEGDLNSAFEIKGKDGIEEILSCVPKGSNVYSLELNEGLDPFKEYRIVFDGMEYSVIMPIIYSTQEFENQYTYAGNDLGASWTKEGTSFRVWAPTAEEVFVVLYKSGDDRLNDEIKSVPMEKDVNGTWVIYEKGDLNGTYYTYRVTRNGETVEACDPYARTTGINGNRAMVIDLDSTNPEGWDKDSNPHAGERITDAIIYEGHVRDLTTEKEAGIDHPGKYLGVIESGTVGKNIKTGLAHMQELGITHLHLLPVYDFGSINEFTTAGGYNWGYDPQNFNVPEGSYSTDATQGAVRVKEFKTMVKGLHDAGISVVMDVVYNHVYNAGEFCVNKIVPGYFSRINEDGSYSNGSGCGNDTATERSMVRKYIVESVCYWADEYHIDGFRFDLVGLIDTDTINEIVTEVHKTHPDVIFYGEGWSMNTSVTKSGITLTTMNNGDKVPEFAFFNDSIRDGLKGSVFNTGTGFASGAQGLTDTISKCFIGADSWCSSPSKTVNYVSCHDNNTLIDRLTLSREDASREQLIGMNKLTASIYILAEGVPFMQAGEEMLRSKVNKDGTYNSNSYSAGDSVNTILYSNLTDKATNEVYEYYKGLIAFRKEHGALRLSTADEVYKYSYRLDVQDDNAFGYVIEGGMQGETAEAICLLYNAGESDIKVAIPEGEWNICINGEKAGTVSLGTVSETATVKAGTPLVLVKGDVDKASSNKAGIVIGLGAISALLAVAATVFTRKKK